MLDVEHEGPLDGGGVAGVRMIGIVLRRWTEAAFEHGAERLVFVVHALVLLQASMRVEPHKSRCHVAN